MSEEICALKCEIATMKCEKELKKENQGLLSRNVTSKREKVS